LQYQLDNMNNEDLLSEMKMAREEKGNLEIQLNKAHIRLEEIGELNTVLKSQMLEPERELSSLKDDKLGTRKVEYKLEIDKVRKLDKPHKTRSRDEAEIPSGFNKIWLLLLILLSGICGYYVCSLTDKYHKDNVKPILSRVIQNSAPFYSNECIIASDTARTNLLERENSFINCLSQKDTLRTAYNKCTMDLKENEYNKCTTDLDEKDKKYCSDLKARDRIIKAREEISKKSRADKETAELRFPTTDKRKKIALGASVEFIL